MSNYHYYTAAQCRTMEKLVERFNADVGFNVEGDGVVNVEGVIHARVHPFSIRGRSAWIRLDGTMYYVDEDNWDESVGGHMRIDTTPEHRSWTVWTS